ncbi:J domain-containing protein [Chloroflexota bacterium]
MENPFAKVMQRGLEAMIEALQEEMGRMSQQLIQGVLTPDMLASVMDMMQKSLGTLGFDMGKIPGMMAREPGFDPYKILGLERSARDEEVKKRYNELLHVLHPDKSGTPGTGVFFQMVREAFEMIKKERGWQ